MNARLSLPPSSSSIASARRFTTHTLTTWSLGDVCDDAALLVSELATNALLHAREPTELRLALDDGELRVEVHDGSPMLPRTRQYGLTSSTGRGLRMVNTLSSAWGAERTEGGKRVWCVLPLEPKADEPQRASAFDFEAVEPL